MAHISLILGVIALFLPVCILSRRQNEYPKGLRPVPGPRGLPLVGNTFQLQPYLQQKLQEWAQVYGELFQIQMGWENWVFLNDPGAVKEILDKQSANTSGRQPMPVGSDLVSGGKRFFLMSYTPEWRKLRAIVHKLLTPKLSATFKPSQELEATQLLHDIFVNTLSNDQESFYMHVRRYTTSVIVTSTYGRRVPQWVSNFLISQRSAKTDVQL